MTTSPTVLVTGASGFIGSALLELAERENVSDIMIVGVDYEDADLRDREAVRQLLAKVKPARVVHLAGKLAKGESLEVLQEHMEHTFQAGKVLLDAALEASVEHMLIAGTIDEFGSRGGELRAGDSAEPVSYYGLCKALLREYAAFLARRTTLRVDWFRPFTVYGPGQEAGNMLLPVAFRAAKSGQPEKFSDGLQERDFIHVEDIAAWLLRALRLPLGAERLGLQVHHLGTGHAASVRSVLEAIGQEFPDAKFELGALARRPGEANLQVSAPYQSDEPSLQGWQPRFTWRAGIAATASWWRSRDAL